MMPTCFTPISINRQQHSSRTHSVRFFSRALLVLWIASAVGCYSQPVTIPINYLPEANTVPLPGASSAHVFVVGEDQRPDKTKVVMTAGPYGQPPIFASNDVADAFRNAVEEELQARGFIIGAGPSSSEVRVQILRF